MINLFYESLDAHWKVWIYTEGYPKNGVCLGSGSTKTEALVQAHESLKREITTIQERWHATIYGNDHQGIRNLAAKFRNFKTWAKAMDPRYYRKITKKEHDDLIAQIEWVTKRLENWPK